MKKYNHAHNHFPFYGYIACSTADIEDLVCGKHTFSEKEVRAVRAGLLEHYDKHQRILPWRHQTGQ